MKKYTVYEIEKLTNGKLTKYKLNQAIANGDLKAEEVVGGKKGRGTPKYFVFENDLQEFLKNLSDEKKHKIAFFNSEPSDKMDEKFDNIIEQIVDATEKLNEENNSEIRKLRDRVQFLELQNSKIEPLFQEGESKKEMAGEKTTKRRELLQELTNVNFLNVSKKKELIQQLSNLA